MPRLWFCVVLGFFFLAFLISLDLKAQWGNWFDLGDVHHETWIIVCIAIALTITAIFIHKKNRKNPTAVVLAR